jgi:hypothetical protein
VLPLDEPNLDADCGAVGLGEPGEFDVIDGRRLAPGWQEQNGGS